MRLRAKRTAIAIFVLIAFTTGMLLPPAADAGPQSTKSQKKEIKSQKKQIKPQNREKRPLRRAGKDFKAKKGAEVAAKVRKLKETSKNVRAALKLLEDKKRTPKVDASFSINGSLSPLKTALNNRGQPFHSHVSFEQQSSIGGDYVEIIFVPVLSLDGEWQGTVISDLYDSGGNVVGEYVAESVLIMPDPNIYAWDEIYEAPVYDGIVGPAIAGPGLFTNIDLGIPLDQQVISQKNHSVTGVVPVNYLQGGPARIQAWANCTFAWCGGADMNCVGSAAWNADVLNSPCFASGCGNDAIGCAWETIWQ